MHGDVSAVRSSRGGEVDHDLPSQCHGDAGERRDGRIRRGVIFQPRQACLADPGSLGELPQADALRFSLNFENFERVTKKIMAIPHALADGSEPWLFVFQNPLSIRLHFAKESGGQFLFGLHGIISGGLCRVKALQTL